MSLERLLERQAGVVSLAQAKACRVSGDTVRRRVRAQRWWQLHPRVYLVGGHRLTDEARVWAAWLWAGDRATVCGPAAAYRHGMLQHAPEVVDVVVPAALHRGTVPGIRLHRRDLAPVDRVGVGGLELTGRPLTALETALVLPDGSTFLDRALQRHVRFPTVYRAYCRHLGRPGWPRARNLLVAAADRADSAAERLLVKILRDGDVAGWVLGYPFGPWRIDLAFPQKKIAVEVDGWAWHVDAELSQLSGTATTVGTTDDLVGPRLTAAIRSDRRKQNALVRAGWDPLRFTWHDLDGRPAAVLAEIRDTLACAA